MRRRHLAIRRNVGVDGGWVLQWATPFLGGYAYGPRLHGMVFRTKQSAKDNKERILNLAAEGSANTPVSAPEPSAYTREHFSRALTWIERNEPHGIQLVARALSATT